MLIITSFVTDYRNLSRTLSGKPVEGCSLCFSRVSCPRSLQVSNIGDISEDSLSAYFESKRSGGSGFVEVVVHREKDCAIVNLENHLGMNICSSPHFKLMERYVNPLPPDDLLNITRSD